MFRAPTTSSHPLTKWCACAAVLLLLPGSFIVLPALWLVRRFVRTTPVPIETKP